MAPEKQKLVEAMRGYPANSCVCYFEGREGDWQICIESNNHPGYIYESGTITSIEECKSIIDGIAFPTVFQATQ